MDINRMTPDEIRDAMMEDAMRCNAAMRKNNGPGSHTPRMASSAQKPRVQEFVLAVVTDEPQTVAQMAYRCEKSPEAVRRAVQKLVKSGRLKMVGDIVNANGGRARTYRRVKWC